MFVPPSSLLPSFNAASSATTSSLLFAYEPRAMGAESSLSAANDTNCFTPYSVDEKAPSAVATSALGKAGAGQQLSLLINRALLCSASNTAQSAANALFSETNTPLIGSADNGALQRVSCAFCGVCPALLAVRNSQQPNAGNDLLRACVACVQRLNLNVLNLAVGTNAALSDDLPTPRLSAEADNMGFEEQRAARHSSGATSTDSGTGGEPPQSAPPSDFQHDYADVFDAAAAAAACASLKPAPKSAHEADAEAELRAISVSSGTFSGAASSGVNSHARSTPSKSMSSIGVAVGAGACANSAPQSPSATTPCSLAFCQRHLGEQVRMYCRTCDQLVCQFCLFSDSQPSLASLDASFNVDHRQHDLQLVNTAVEQQTAAIRVANQEAKSKLAEMRHMVVGLQQLSTKLVVHYQKTQTQIDDTAALLAKLVAEHRTELQRVLENAYQTRAAPISTLMQRAHEQLEKLQQLSDFVDKVLVTAANPVSPNRGIELLMLHKLLASNLGALLRDAVPELTRQFTSLMTACCSTTAANGSAPYFAEMDYLVDEKLIHAGVPHLLGSLRSNTCNTAGTQPNGFSPVDSNRMSAGDADLVDGASRERAAQAGMKSASANQQKLGSNSQLSSAASASIGSQQGVKPTALATQMQQTSAALASQLAHSLKLNCISSKPAAPKATGFNANAADFSSGLQSDASRQATMDAELAAAASALPMSATGTNGLPNDPNQLQLQTLAALHASGIDLARMTTVEQQAMLTRLRQQIEMNSRLAAPLPLPQLVLSSMMGATAGSACLSGGAPQLRSTTKRTKMIYHVKFGEFGVMNGQFTEPSGVAVSLNNEIIVADTNNHRIQVFEPDGRFKFQFGECGKRDSQLLYPNRVAVNPLNGDIVVTERSPTHQIQVYSQNGQFLRKFGANVLQHPRGVTVDKQGRILVVECKVMRILIFDQLGNLLNKFGCSKYLEFPNAIAVNDKEEIFVSDNRAHCVKVFDYSGRFLRQVGGEGVTNYPIGVAVSPAGDVLVADNHNNFNLTVFNAEGELVAALESKVKHAQCFDIALLRDASDSIVLASKDYRLYVYRYKNPVPVSD